MSETVDDLPDVPVLPETLLSMELQRSGSTVDLRGFSEVVLSDLGATVQILRLAGREYGDREDRPARIEDCIADLGIEACMGAAMDGVRGEGASHADVVEMWGHSKEIALQCKHLAENTFGMNPSEACLAGLLHDIGALPSILGWGRNDLCGDYALCALKMARKWCFPHALKDYFCEAYLPGYNRHWSRLMSSAHDAAAGSWSWCPLNELQVKAPARMQG